MRLAPSLPSIRVQPREAERGRRLLSLSALSCTTLS
jgi:hypothetical protein